jgi:fatty-acyl-CoA synthase
MRVPLVLGDYLDRGELYGERIAVVDEPGTPGSLGRVSFASFVRRARGMALALERMGIGHGERVAVVTPNAARFLIAFFGVSAFGRVLVPVNFRLSAEEVGFIVEHSGASALLLDPELDEPLAGVGAPRRILLDGVHDAELFAEADGDPAEWRVDEDATTSINYTSGTTARPKGVELSHRTLWLNAVTLGWHMGVGDRDVLLHTLPMFHCNGWGMPYAAAAMGVRQVVLRRVDGEEILGRIEAEGVTLMCGAPAVVAAILAAAAKRRAAGREVPGAGTVRMVVAGAPPPTEIIERFAEDLGWEFIQIYGLTETAPLATVNREPFEWDGLDRAERARRLGRAGVPALGVGLRVDGEGEVLVRSNHVFTGYWAQPDQTDAAIRDGWFHTGDGAELDGRYVAIRDRKKDVIITGGENVSSIEVEDVLFRHPAVSEVAVIGVPDDRWGEAVKALVVLQDGVPCSEAELIEFARSQMAHFKCPRSIEFRDALPRTATGKLQKARLREPYWAGRERLVG